MSSSLKSSQLNILSLFYTMVILIEMPLMSSMTISVGSGFESYSWLILTNFLIQTYVLYKTKGLVNFLYAFVAFYYVFHFGQVIMLGFFPWYDYDYMNYITTYMMSNPGILNETMVLCVNCINIFVLGALLCPVPHDKTKNLYSSYDYKKICKYVFVILFSFRVILDAIDLVVAYYFGYSGTFESFLPGVFSALGLMGYSVIPLYYFSIDNPRRKRNFFFFILIYLLFTMLSGNRGHQLVCIIGLFIVHLTQTKLTPKTILVLICATFAGLMFIDFIFDIRGEGLESLLNSKTNISDSKESKNIILETLGTFGETIYTPFLVLDSYKDVKPFWGECFIKSLVSVIPDFTGTFKDLNNEAVFAKMVSSGHTIGGSFSGEMYYNFHNTYFIPTFILGYLFSMLSTRVSFYIKKGQLSQVYLSLPICVLFVWWIRDSIGNMTREIVWLWLLFFMMKKIVTRKKYAKSTTNT